MEEENFNMLDMDAFNDISNQIIEEEIPEEPSNNIQEEILDDNDNNEITEDENPEEVSEEINNQDEEEETDSSGSEDSSQNVYSFLTSALIEEGVLPSLGDKKIENSEDLIEAFRNEIKNNEYSDLNENQKKYLEGLRNNIPEPEIKENIKLENQLNSITPEMLKENEELRRQIILQDFINKGYSEEKAQKLLKRSVDIEEDYEDSLDSLKNVKELHNQEYQKRITIEKEKEKQQQIEQQKQIELFKKSIMETKEIIPGIKVTPSMAEKVYRQAKTPVETLENGQQLNAIMKSRMDDPINFETKLNYLFYLTKGFTDFGKIIKSQKTKAVKELDKIIQGSTVKVKKEEISNSDSAFNFDIVNNIQ